MKKILLLAFGCFASVALTYSQIKVLTDGSLRGNQSGAIRINTGYGYVDIGPKSSGSCHFYTDQSYFYFNKSLQLYSGVFTVTSSIDYCFKKSSGQYPLMVIRNSNGYVGINLGQNNPQYPLDVNGIIRGTNLAPTHPGNKANDQPLNPNQVKKLYKLEGICYTVDPPEIQEGEEQSKSSGDEYYLRNHFGFNITEMEKLFPDMVYRDSLGVPGIINDEFIPLIVEALKEQDKLIKSLEKEISSLKSDGKSSMENESLETNKCWLGKNKPNAFDENTTIEYYLSSTVQKATLYIYDLQGKQIKSINLAEHEQGSVVIYGSELQPGIYHYSLIADGNLIGIEKMVLTD